MPELKYTISLDMEKTKQELVTLIKYADVLKESVISNKQETEETAEGLPTRFELIWEPVHWQEYSGKSFKSGSEGLAGSQIGAGEKK